MNQTPLKKLWTQYKVPLILGVVIAIGIFWSLFPEEAFAIKLEAQLDKMNALTTGKLKKYGLSGATIGGGIWALFKGNAKLAGIIIGIGVLLGYYLAWIQGGMQF